MKITMGPLVAGLSGKAGDAVASKWMGRHYLRTHVIPKLSVTAGHLAQRARVARMAKLWRSCGTDAAALFDVIGLRKQMSGYNLVAKTCLDQLFASEAMSIIPSTPDIDGPASIVCTVGASVGQIAVTTTQGSAVGTDYGIFCTCPDDPAEVGKEEPDVWTLRSPVLMSTICDSPQTIMCTTDDKLYHVALLVIDAATLATATVIGGGVAAMGTSKEV